MDQHKSTFGWTIHPQRSSATESAAVWRCFRAVTDFLNFKDSIMKTRLITSVGIVLLTLSLGACSNMSRRDENTAVGAVIGGVAGAALTGGSTAGVVGGAAVGGVIGNQIGK